MRFQLEMISKDFLEEVGPLIEKHKDEISHWDTALNIDPELYIAADASGNYRGYSVRDEGELVGYVGYWVISSPHENLVQASQDVLYLKEEYRKGLLAVKLLRFSERDLKKREMVQCILQQSSSQKPIGSLFKRLGYTEASIVYKKEI